MLRQLLIFENYTLKMALEAFSEIHFFGLRCENHWFTFIDAVSMGNYQQNEFQEIETIFYKKFQVIKIFQTFDIMKNLYVTRLIMRSKLFGSLFRLFDLLKNSFDLLKSDLLIRYDNLHLYLFLFLFFKRFIVPSSMQIQYYY